MQNRSVKGNPPGSTSKRKITGETHCRCAGVFDCGVYAAPEKAIRDGAQALKVLRVTAKRSTHNSKKELL